MPELRPVEPETSNSLVAKALIYSLDDGGSVILVSKKKTKIVKYDRFAEDSSKVDDGWLTERNATASQKESKNILLFILTSFILV